MDLIEEECIGCNYYNNTSDHYHVCLSCIDILINKRTNLITMNQLEMVLTSDKVINSNIKCDKCNHTKVILIKVPLCINHGQSTIINDSESDSEDMYSVD